MDENNYFMKIIDAIVTAKNELNEELEDGFQISDLKALAKALLFDGDFRDKVQDILKDIPNAWDHFQELKIKEIIELVKIAKERIF